MGANEKTNGHIACRGALHRGEKGQRLERADLQQNLNRQQHVAITGGMPLRWYIVAVGYGTIVILLGSYPWNILLMLLSLPPMDFPRRDQMARCWGGCLVDTGHHDER